MTILLKLSKDPFNSVLAIKFIDLKEEVSSLTGVEIEGAVRYKVPNRA
jgi:hypothetical protein